MTTLQYCQETGPTARHFCLEPKGHVDEHSCTCGHRWKVT